MDIKKLQDEIEADEGFKLEIYLDHLNLPTLGIGHLIKEDDPEYGKPVGTKVSYERCSALFEKDIKITIDDCKKVYDDWDDMDEEVKRICCNMMFNLGYPRYSKFKLMIKGIKDKNYDEAAKQMKQSRWYNQVTNRAERLIERMKKVG